MGSRSSLNPAVQGVSEGGIVNKLFLLIIHLFYLCGSFCKLSPLRVLRVFVLSISELWLFHLICCCSYSPGFSASTRRCSFSTCSFLPSLGLNYLNFSFVRNDIPFTVWFKFASRSKMNLIFVIVHLTVYHQDARV